MSSSNSCFLTCIQVSQEADQVVWYSHLSQNFPQFIVTHTVKDFGIVNKAEIDVFLELSCLFHDPADVGNLISGSSAFSKTRLTSGSSWFKYCWSLDWKILSITLLVCEKHKLELRLPGEISITSDMQMTSPYGRKWRVTKKPLDESKREEWKSWLKAQHSGNEDHGIWSHHFMGNR